jgi:DNA-binding XRE family transcriptional regulator
MNNKIIKKDLKDYVQTEPLQLRLFELSKQNSDKYSNTIEMYDSMPKYHLGGVEREKGKTTEALPVISRDFVYRNKGFKINISPAAIVDKKSGKTISYYPSQREELVEDVIRKIAANKRKRGIYLDEDMAVRFTYYEIEQELLKIGHGYSKAEIKQAIEVCSKTIIEITSKDGNQVSQTSPLFPFVAKESKEMGGQERVIVMFHPLVTKSVDSGTYRTINYDRLMKLKMYLARWLHKHISHVFTQATEKNPYKIKLSTIVTNSGMKSYEKISHTVIQVKKALDELIKCQTVASYEVEFHKEKNKI